jgi:hypothetical protein
MFDPPVETLCGGTCSTGGSSDVMADTILLIARD